MSYTVGDYWLAPGTATHVSFGWYIYVGVNWTHAVPYGPSFQTPNFQKLVVSEHALGIDKLPPDENGYQFESWWYFVTIQNFGSMGTNFYLEGGKVT